MLAFVDNCLLIHLAEGQMTLRLPSIEERTLDAILTKITKDPSSTCKIDGRDYTLGIARNHLTVESSSGNIQLKLPRTEALNRSFMIALGNWRASIISATWQIPQRPEGVP